MEKFRSYFLIENSANILAYDEDSNAIIKECLIKLYEISIKEPNILMEGPRKKDSYRREFDPEEHEMFFKHLKSGKAPQDVYGDMFGDKGYAPAIKAWQDEIQTGEGSEEEQLARVKAKLGANVLPQHYKEIYEKSLIKNIIVKLQSNQALTPQEQNIYKLIQGVMPNVSGVSFDQGARFSNKPNRSISPELYDKMLYKIRDPHGRMSPKDKDYLRRNVEKPEPHLEANFNEAGLSLIDVVRGKGMAAVDDIYNKLIQSGVQLVSDDDAANAYLTKVRNDVMSGRAFTQNKSKAAFQLDSKRNYRSATGIGVPGDNPPNPLTSPGALQAMTGKVRPIKKDIKKFGELEDMPNAPSKIPSLFVPTGYHDRTRFPDDEINDMYGRDTATFDNEIKKPANKAASKFLSGYLQGQDYTDAIADIVGQMMDTTGIPNWREKEGVRQSYANYFALQQRDKFFRNKGKAKTGLQSAGDEGDDILAQKATSDISGKRTDVMAPADMSTKEKQELVGQAKEMFGKVDTSKMSPEDVQKLQDAVENLFGRKRSKEGATMAIEDLKDLARKNNELKDALSALGFQFEDEE